MSALFPERPNFDQIAQPYRWLEYLAFGRALERCRFHFLAELGKHKNALVIGDGDGRFLARLLAINQDLCADAVDTSAAMLRLTRKRCHEKIPAASNRLFCHRVDAVDFAREGSRSGGPYDLVVTHFFLDCLDQDRVDALATAVTRRTAPGAVWIVSDFRIPDGAMKIPGRILVRALYVAFGFLAGLKTSSLPDHSTALREAGFAREAVHRSLGGVLFTESWRRTDPP